MMSNLTDLLVLPFGKPLAEIDATILESFGDNCYKINDQIYLLTMSIDNIPVYRGLAWVVSERAAAWIFTGRWSDDEIKLPPPDILLPMFTIKDYQSVCEFGRQVDQKNFVNDLPGPRRVKFSNYTYYYRMVEPRQSDDPIGIEIDRRPEQYRHWVNSPVIINSWQRTITKTFLDFQQCSLNNLRGGGVNTGSHLIQLRSFGKPDNYRESILSVFNPPTLCYFDLGLEFVPSVDMRLAYIYIYLQPNCSSLFSEETRSSTFRVFSGDLLYGNRLISASELEDFPGLINSFQDSRFKRYDTDTYIQEINGIRTGTIVFTHDYIILY